MRVLSWKGTMPPLTPFRPVSKLHTLLTHDTYPSFCTHSLTLLLIQPQQTFLDPAPPSQKLSLPFLHQVLLLPQ